MTELKERLESLGLTQYLEAFVSEGFDSWETIQDITESDLDYLTVKLGHRRKLQRAIAEARGYSTDRALPGHNRKTSFDTSYRTDDSAAENADNRKPSSGAPTTGSTGTKRKYRRHPKPDENAPERPASAYVIFSNKVREELKGKDLSFTEIAKIVGERWQVLASKTRDIFERQAQTAKEKYYAELAEYKKTSQYALYQEYLADFKAKHATPRTEGKRTKLEPQTTTSTRSGSHDNLDRESGSRSAHNVPEGYAFGPTTKSESSPVIGGGSPSSTRPAYSLSSTASPATYANLQSPLTGPSYSPQSTSPTATYPYPAYELPHHARSGHTNDLRLREPPYPTSRPHNLPPDILDTPHSPNLTTATIGSGNASGPRRTLPRPPTSLPPLAHSEDSLSSDSGSSIHSQSQPQPYQGSLLPVLDATKADRTLPHPVPSLGVGTGVVASSGPIERVGGSRGRSEGHMEALLRATELARDAEMEGE